MASSMRKKVLSSTLTATLVLSSAGVAALPGMALAAGSGTITSSQDMDQALLKLTSELKALRDSLQSTGGFNAVQAARLKAQSLSGAEKYYIVYGSQIIDPSKQNVINAITDLLNISYASTQNDSDLSNTVQQVKQDVQLLNPNITGTDLYNFYLSLKEYANKNIPSQIMSGSNLSANDVLDNALKYAVQQNPVFQGTLSSNGIQLSDLPSIRQRAQNLVDPDQKAQQALITAAANMKLALVATKNGQNVSNPLTMTVGDTYTYGLQFTGVSSSIDGKVDIANMMQWNVDDSSKATINGKTITAKAAGTVHVTATYHNYVVKSFAVTINNSNTSGGGTGGGGGSTGGGGGSTGGGGGGGSSSGGSSTGGSSAGVTTISGVSGTVVDLTSQSSVTTTKDANGQTVTTITVDVATIAKALTDATVKQITFTVTDVNSAKVDVAIPAQAISQVAANNPANSFTVQTPFGSINVPVKVLTTDALAAALGASANDLDLNQVYLHITIAKASSETGQAVNSAASSLGASVLAAPVDFALQVTSKDKTGTIDQFGNVYVARALPIPQNATASNTVGVRVATTTLADGTVQATLYPVPTRVSNGAATLLRPGDSVYAVIQTQKSFSDLAGHWAQAKVNLLASKLILSGYADGTFQPNATITRAEFATAIVRALGLTPNAAAASFSDLGGHWAQPYVGAAVQAGLLAGYPDGTFQPEKQITREEAAALLANAVRFLSLQASGTAKTYADQNKIDSWAKDSVDTLSQFGIMNGYPDGSFGPAKNITRAETVSIILGLLEKANLISE